MVVGGRWAETLLGKGWICQARGFMSSAEPHPRHRAGHYVIPRSASLAIKQAKLRGIRGQAGDGTIMAVIGMSVGMATVIYAFTRNT